MSETTNDSSTAPIARFQDDLPEGDSSSTKRAIVRVNEECVKGSDIQSQTDIMKPFEMLGEDIFGNPLEAE